MSARSGTKRDSGASWAWALTTIACALLFQSTARADEIKARALYTDGEAAFTAGRFTDAARAFEGSYQESHRPKLLWNIAQSWRRQFGISHDVADLRRAEAVYQHYEELAESDSDRAEARQLSAEVATEVRAAEAERSAREADAQKAAASEQAARLDGRGPVDRARPGRLKGAGIAMLAVGVAALGGGVSCALVARGAYDEINTPVAGYVFNTDTQNKMHLFEAVGDVLLGVGVASLVTGAVLLGIGASEAKRLPVSFMPSFSPSSAGAVLAGEF